MRLLLQFSFLLVICSYWLIYFVVSVLEKPFLASFKYFFFYNSAILLLLGGKVFMVEKKKYRCAACNWKFSRNYKPGLCPYCGRATVEEMADNSAGTLVKEIEELGRV